MINISENIKNIRSTLPETVKLVAVSKTQPKEFIEEAYKTGQRIFGESKPLEMRDKYQLLPKDIEWHFIGHLQTNKVKYLVSFVSLIHSVDTFKLLQTINKEAFKAEKVVPCLLQMHIAKEETKFGFSFSEIEEFLCSDEFKEMQNVKICGLMGMATYSEDEELIRSEFKYLADCFQNLKEKYFADNEYFKEISMGMSGDYLLAMEYGSTLIRVGSSIFGERVYL